MEKFKEIAGIFLFTLFFGVLTGIMVAQFVEEIDLTSLTKSEQKIIAKKSEKGLFQSPTYYVQTDTEHNTKRDLFHRITSSQMKHLEAGDKLQGYTTYGDNFFTLYDLLTTSFFLLFAIILFGGMTLLGLFVLISEIPNVDDFLNNTFLGCPSSGEFGMGLLYVTLAIFLCYSGQTGLNLFHKIMPINQTITNAEIIDRYRDINFSKYADSTYQLTVQFQDEDGQSFLVDKEVTNQTFHDHLNADSFPISYREKNPYDIFDANTTANDVLQVSMYWRSILTVLLIAITIYSIYRIYKHKKQGKTEENLEVPSK